MHISKMPMPKDTIRVASCLCGAFKIRTKGDPVRVNMCNCNACQRRSGSAFQLGAIFKDSQIIEMSGETRTYSRPAKQGRTIDLRLCPICGVSVCWNSVLIPEMIGIHGGCFAGQDFPAPTHILYADNHLPWVELPDAEVLTPLPD